MTSGNQIRSDFLGFFGGREHEVVPSSPIVPRNDPTLMFTNSGMVQFKDVFTGLETRPYSRATTSQKCVRAGGKHNDLDNVGYTARHHTFFEMLGNFSFGDYFKDVAIEQAWTYSTKVAGLPAEKILVTVHATDEEAADLWKKIAGLPDERIIRINSDDNWWRMGDTGPNGPCSELFYDHGPEVWGGPPGSPEEDGDRFVEFWNLVFMQYETFPDGTSQPLPKPSIDTGMGLERMTTILQGVHNNYDTDLFQPIIQASAELTGQAPDGPMVTSHRVVADHLRCAAFLIAEGVLPSNEGRGYVLRRIMRRGMRHAHLLGAKDPLMHRLAPALIDLMGGHYSELRAADALIKETLRAEEVRFQATLDRGLKLLDAELDTLPEGAPLPGATAFKLYDTYGFPLDLTADILRGQSREIDQPGYDAAMAEQKAKARAAWSGTGETANLKVWYDIRDRVGPTDFLGYADTRAGAQVVALVQNGEEVQSVSTADPFEVVFNQTPFYAEQGGQTGDQGAATGKTVSLTITDTQKRADGVYSHAAVLATEGGTLRVGDSLTLEVGADRRLALCAHHSATHLLHEALRRRLGDHIAQKGSLVAPDRLRFDISHGQAISAAEIADVEREVNARIRACSPVETRVMGLEEAKTSGARALFGEKYGDEVRVVSMGGAEPGENHPWSVELCGGTHVKNTGQIGFFKIVREEGTSAGVRRIEALAAEAAEMWVARQTETVSAAGALLNATQAEIPSRIETLQSERRALERELADTRRKLATGGGGAGAAAEKIGDISLTLREVAGLGPKELKTAVDELLAQAPGIAALAAESEGKGSIVIGVSPAYVDRLDAVALVRAAAPALGAKGGGGRPNMAQTGGPNGAGVAEALKAVETAVRAALS